MRHHRQVLVIAALGCLLGFLPTPSGAVELDLNLAVGADFAGEFDLGGIEVDAGTGYTLGLELVVDVPVIELGLGLEYGFARDAEGADIDAATYQLYAIGRCYFGPFYVAGRLGYSDVSLPAAIAGDASGRSWGLGGGVTLFDLIKLELLCNQLGPDLGYQGWSARLLYTF